MSNPDTPPPLSSPQDQQLVIISMAEQYVRLLDPDDPTSLNEMLQNWSTLLPSAGGRSEMAYHVMSAASIIGGLIHLALSEHDETCDCGAVPDRAATLAGYRNMILSHPAGIAGLARDR